MILVLKMVEKSNFVVINEGKNIQKRIKPELFLHFHFRTTLEKMNLYIKEVTGSKYY